MYSFDHPFSRKVLFFVSWLFSPACCTMDAECSSYTNVDGVLVDAFSCPKPANPLAIYCCGFNDMKYCCDDPNSFFPYEYGYMWWLSFGALVGLSVAAVVLLAFLIIVCVLCYLFIATKPSRLDNGLALRPRPSAEDFGEGPSQDRAAHLSAPCGIRKIFVSRKLGCDDQQPSADHLFQRCFPANLTVVKVESPSC